jgi:outer membrane protein OmpA-like peptidoglycan-associated protein
LLVTGHTARIGSEQGQLRLSEERARIIADYLLEQGRDTHGVFTRWAGGKEPIASNNTEEGRSRNRRVEITLLDK